jgi:hypothetical protein
MFKRLNNFKADVSFNSNCFNFVSAVVNVTGTLQIGHPAAKPNTGRKR